MGGHRNHPRIGPGERAQESGLLFCADVQQGEVLVRRQAGRDRLVAVSPGHLQEGDGPLLLGAPDGLAADGGTAARGSVAKAAADQQIPIAIVVHIR